MPGHVNGMADAGNQFAVTVRADQRLLRLMIIPIVNAVVMRARMIRLLRQNFANHQLRSVARIPHGGKCQQSERFHIVRVFDAQRFQNFCLIAPLLRR